MPEAEPQVSLPKATPRLHDDIPTALPVPIASPVPFDATTDATSRLAKPTSQDTLFGTASTVDTECPRLSSCDSVSTSGTLNRIGDLTIKIVGRREDTDGVTKYSIRVTGPHGAHVVRRRYTDFETLHREMFGEECGTTEAQAAAMPPKSFLKSIFSPKFQAERQERLGEVATAALVSAADKELEECPQILRAFLGLDEWPCPVKSSKEVCESTPNETSEDSSPAKSSAIDESSVAPVATDAQLPAATDAESESQAVDQSENPHAEVQDDGISDATLQVDGCLTALEGETSQAGHEQEEAVFDVGVSAAKAPEVEESSKGSVTKPRKASPAMYRLSVVGALAALVVAVLLSVCGVEKFQSVLPQVLIEHIQKIEMARGTYAHKFALWFLSGGSRRFNVPGPAGQVIK